jgi:hypothetical protein
MYNLVKADAVIQFFTAYHHFKGESCYVILYTYDFLGPSGFGCLFCPE